MGSDINILFGSGAVTLLGIVGYFLKKTNEKIDGTSEAVHNLSLKLECETKAARNEIVQIFQDVCHERQGHCSRLQAANLDILKAHDKTICSKLEKIVEDRDKRWARQEEINERFKTHMYKTKNGGRSWDNKEE